MSNDNAFNYTINTLNQPGIRRTPLKRSEIRAAMEALGLDPAQILSFEASNEGVSVTATLVDTEGHRVLAQGHDSGFLKHTYTIPFEDELCEAGAFYDQEEGE